MKKKRQEHEVVLHCVDEEHRSNQNYHCEEVAKTSNTKPFTFFLMFGAGK